MNQNYTVGKCWTDNESKSVTGIKVSTGKGGRIIVLRAGSKEGFVPNAALVFNAKNDGDYHHQMNHAVFEEWFRSQLLPNIPPASIIVMDIASYHSIRVENLSTASSIKATIREWLIKKGAEPRDYVLKGQLLEMVKEYSRKIKIKHIFH